MKTLGAALLLFATAAHAGDPVVDRRDQAVHEDAIAVSRGASRVAPSSVRDSRADYWMIIPAAASSAGSRGTFYRSDVMIANFRNVQQTLRARWIPQNQSLRHRPAAGWYLSYERRHRELRLPRSAHLARHDHRHPRNDDDECLRARVLHDSGEHPGGQLGRPVRHVCAGRFDDIRLDGLRRIER